MEVVLPAPLTPTTRMTAGGSGTRGGGRAGAPQVALDLLADSFEDLRRGARANIGGDQGVFQFLENFAVDLLAAADGVFNFFEQSGAGLLDAGLQAIEETGTLN